MNERKNYRDFYDLFGLPTNASKEEIKERTNHIIKKYHPDNKDSNISITQFKTINYARKVLENEDKREEYDNLGHHKYVDEYGENKVDGYNFEGRKSITESEVKNVKSDDVDELIKNNTTELHNYKNKINKKKKNKNKKQKGKGPENINYNDSKSSFIGGLFVNIGRFLKSKELLYTILITFLVFIYVLSYLIFGSLFTLFIILLSIILFILFNKINF